MNNGEWECAIKIKNTADFHGGFHGYERQETYYSIVNGNLFNVEIENFIITEEFVFIQKSVIYKQGTKDEAIANHFKKYTFTNDGLLLHQEIEWLQILEIDYAYLAMLPIKRTSDDSINGIQITDTATSDYDNELYDVSMEGHITSVSPQENRKKNVTRARIWSNNSKILAEVKIMWKQTIANSFFIQNTKQYNKFYFSYTGNNHITKIGERWDVSSFYCFKIM